MTGPSSDAAVLLRAMRSALGENDMMAYLAMMAVRLIHLHRVLKPTGSLYLHCDPTASHYLKLLLDGIFGATNFQNEIVWKRAHTVKGNVGQGSRFFGVNTDSIFFYSKTGKHVFQQPFTGYTKDYIDSFYRYTEKDGRRYRLISMIGPGGAAKGNPEYEVMGVTRYWRYSRKKMQELIDDDLVVQTNPGTVPQRKQYLDKGQGVAVQSLWDDIPALSASSAERLGYPTQKPVALLERIVGASSKPGDVVLDPFCGCGTTVHAAQKMDRQWVGIDITHLAISLIERRLKDAFPAIKYEIHGVPLDLDGARDLANRDKHEFQKWIVAKVGGQPYKGGKKGMDRGVDGYLHFRDAAKKPQFAIISVKGGGIKSGDIRDLKGTIDREKAAMGIFLSLNEPTREMLKEAAAAGLYDSGGHKVPRIQILTAKEVLDNRRPQIPFGHTEGFKKAGREEDEVQGSLL